MKVASPVYPMYSEPGRLSARPHVADASVSRSRINVIGALNYTTSELHFELFEYSMKRQHVVPFLDKLAQSSCQGILTIVVMDNASIHHCIEPAMLDKWRCEHLFFTALSPAIQPGIKSDRNFVETG